MALGTRSFGDGPVGVGIIGAGNISDQYLSNLTTFPDVRVIAVADLIEERAKAQAEKYGVPRSGGVDTVLGDPEIDIVVNLTIPAVHVEVSEAIIAAGKHVWTEKPIGVSREESRRLLEKADAAGLRVGVAPDTVLGPGVQTAKRAIARGDIGRPLFAQTTFQWQGPEIFHPNPAFLYAKGGGPLLDMGPYYVSTLITLLGPVESVVGSASRSRDTRTIGSGPRAGETVPVEIFTHVTGVLRHTSGALSTIVMSFDTVATHASNIEVHGERGSMKVPDPNGFAGDVLLHPLGGEWTTVEPSAGYVGAGRGFGVADLAAAEPGTGGRANGDLALHVLDVMTSLLAAADSGETVEVTSTCERPALVPLTEARQRSAKSPG